VVLADAEDVEGVLVGQLDLLEEVAQALLRADGVPGGGIGGALPERVDAQLHRSQDRSVTAACYSLVTTGPRT
jgi:hypothetical protein